MAATAIQTTVTVTFRTRGVEPSPIRMFARDGHKWMIASDICRVIGIRTDNVLRLVPEQDRSHATVLTKGSVQSVTTITASGLKLLVMQSSKPAAKVLLGWMVGEVLPSTLNEGSTEAAGRA